MFDLYLSLDFIPQKCLSTHCLGSFQERGWGHLEPVPSALAEPERGLSVWARWETGPCRFLSALSLVGETSALLQRRHPSAKATVKRGWKSIGAGGQGFLGVGYNPRDTNQCYGAGIMGLEHSPGLSLGSPEPVSSLQGNA